MAKDEDYLDGLLEKFMKDPASNKVPGKLRKSTNKHTTSDDFFDELDELDDDFLSDDSDELLRAFEEELGLNDDELSDADVDESFKDRIDEMIEGISNVINADTPSTEPEAVSESAVALEPQEDVLGQIDAGLSQLAEAEISEAALSPEPSEPSPAEPSEPSPAEPPEPSPAEPSEPSPAELLAGTTNLADLLAASSGTGGDSMDDIDDIEQLIAETDAAAEQAQAPAEADEPAETDEPEPAADQISKVDIPAEPGIANSPVGETDAAPRKGIFAFLANLIFGKDAPEDENELKARQAEASGISPEDQAILDELEGKKAAEEKDAKKAAKKAAAEAKKKAKQEAAEAKKKEKAAKKAAKPPKPKKEKKPKEPKKPVNKRPIIVVAVFTASVFIFVNLLSSAATYTADVSRATSLYNAGQYVEAYEELAGSSAHKGDQDFYDGAKMLAILQQSIFRHDTDVAAGRNAEALDILVRAIGTYKTNFDRADELGILSQYTNLELQIESLLEEYGVTYDQALELYAMTDRDEYTVAILQLVAE